jgi:transcriptional regulator with XRE-family HTH domain
VGQQAPAREHLSRRLRALRTAPDFGGLTQGQLAKALKVSTALISSWESGSAVPPVDRLRAYSRFFATHRSVDGRKVHLLPAEDLRVEEVTAEQELQEELFRLREAALHDGAASYRETGALGGRFWYFPDHARVTIVCTPLSRRQLGLLPDGTLPEDAAPITAYSQPSHPNYIESLRTGDIDALTELVGHIRAENPTVEVRWMTYDHVGRDELSSHLILLGTGHSDLGKAERGTFLWFTRRLELPIRLGLPPGGDEEFDTEFVVRTDEEGEPTHLGAKTEVYRPRFLHIDSEPDRPRVVVDGVPQLEFDTALIVRKPNPINLSTRIIICTGIFSRGTYGAVRTFTAATLRTRNEQFLAKNFDIEDFWLLLHVPVLEGQTATPDLEREFLRLRHS